MTKPVRTDGHKQGRRGTVIARWAKEIERGKDDRGTGKRVLKMMEEYYEKHGKESGTVNMCTLRSKITKVRTAYLKHATENRLHTQFNATKQALLTAGASADVPKKCKTAIGAFLKLSPHEMAKEHARFRRKRKRGTEQKSSLCDAFESPDSAKNSTPITAVRTAFENLKIAPPAFETFHLATDDSAWCKKRQQSALLERDVIRINDPVQLLVQSCRDIIKACAQPGFKFQRKPRGGLRTGPSPYDLIAALLLASGRRTTELLNGNSTFESSGSRERFCCLFRGQLKRDSTDEPPYLIPLLCTFDEFDTAYHVLQTWQGKSLTKDSTKTSVLYQGNLSKHMNSKESNFAKQGLTKPHQLRALYVQYVLKMFDWGTARDVRVAKYVLGHVSADTSDNYDHIRFADDTLAALLKFKTSLSKKQGSFGSRIIEEYEMKRVERALSV